MKCLKKSLTCHKNFAIYSLVVHVVQHVFKNKFYMKIYNIININAIKIGEKIRYGRKYKC